MRFHVITPSMRHRNLSSIVQNLSYAKLACEESSIEIVWHVVFAPIHRTPFSERIARVDKLIGELPPNGWFYFLSDDNIMPPTLPMRVANIIKTREQETKAIHFSQIFPQGVRWGADDHLFFGKVDGGQVVFNIEYYQSFGWSYDQFGPGQHEGRLFQEMKARDPSVWHHEPSFKCYYDGLTALQDGIELSFTDSI